MTEPDTHEGKDARWWAEHSTYWYEQAQAHATRASDAAREADSLRQQLQSRPAFDEIRPPFYEGCAKRGGVCDCGDRPCAIAKPVLVRSGASVIAHHAWPQNMGDGIWQAVCVCEWRGEATNDVAATWEANNHAKGCSMPEAKPAFDEDRER